MYNSGMHNISTGNCQDHLIDAVMIFGFIPMIEEKSPQYRL